jgi:hypothetical protein
MPMSHPEREERRLRTAAVLSPWIMVVLVGGSIAVKAGLDARSKPYVRAQAFHALPGCPVRLEAGRSLARRCLDRRYLIRQGSDHYGLPRDLAKGSRGWLRVGRDAARLRDCMGDTCRVVEVRRDVFPHGRAD